MEAKNKFTHTAAELMPKDEKSIKVLLERAKKLAVKAERVEKSEVVNYIHFKLANNEYYGIPYQWVQEVIKNVSITQIISSHECVSGITNYHGILLTLLDLRKFFEFQKIENSQSCYIIVVKKNGISVGILVDEIEGINQYDAHEIKNEITYQGVVDPRCILGIHQGITTILNIETIILDLQSILRKT